MSICVLEEAHFLKEAKVEKRVKCDSCGEYFDLDEEYKTGDIVSCPTCGDELRIISLNPPKTEFVSEYEELKEDYPQEEDGDDKF